MSSSNESINLSGDGGVVKKIIKQGISDKVPSLGDTVYLHYTGVLAENGEKFDSSLDRNEPFSFSLGKSQVIKAWDMGVATMKLGEVCELLCRADYAYGSSGSPPKIPGNAMLKFEMELLRFEGEDISPDRDGTIFKSIIEEGEKYNCPSEHAPVVVHAVGTHKGRVFYDKKVGFILGEGSEVGLPEGVDRAVRRVNMGEKCRVTLKGRFAYGANPPAEYNLPLHAEVEFTLFLPDFEKVKASWELTESEKIGAAQTLKERGTKFLNEGKLTLALNKYNSIGVLLEHTTPSDAELKANVEAILVAGWLNCSLVNMKQGETSECIKHCDKVLEKQPKNVKALYRKGQALQHRKEFEEATEVYNKVIEIEPKNKAAEQQILVCKSQIAELLALEKKRYAGLFSRLSKPDHNEEPSCMSSSSKSYRFLRTGLPFFALVFGSAFALHYFQQVRYDFRRTKRIVETTEGLKKDLENAGIEVKRNVTLDKIANEIFEIDTENWQNIRGPREYEDNAEYLRARAVQQTEAKKKRKEAKEKRRLEERQKQQNGESASPTNSDSGSSSGSRSIIKSLSTPHKMVFVANMGLKMGAGKLAAQVGHATLGVYCNAMKSKNGQAAIKSWNYHGAMKIVVKGQDADQLNELSKQAKELGLYYYLVQDAGHTQIPAGSRTILGLFGPIEEVNKVTGTLKLL